MHRNGRSSWRPELRRSRSSGTWRSRVEEVAGRSVGRAADNKAEIEPAPAVQRSVGVLAVDIEAVCMAG